MHSYHRHFGSSDSSGFPRFADDKVINYWTRFSLGVNPFRRELISHCLEVHRMAPPEYSVSTKFNDPKADIIFRSSDGILFHIHSKYLNATTAGFGPSDFVLAKDEHVILSETSKVLEILFQFILPCSQENAYHQPSVFHLGDRLFFEVAEAAEKYIVFGAMNTCTTYMQYLIKEHPIKVLNHCVAHGYLDLGDDAALESLACPLPEVARGLTYPGLLSRWIIYYNQWLQLSKIGVAHIKYYTNRECEAIVDIRTRYLINCSNDIRLARDFPRSDKTCGSHDCSRRLDKALVHVNSVEGVDSFLIPTLPWYEVSWLYAVKFRTITL